MKKLIQKIKSKFHHSKKAGVFSKQKNEATKNHTKLWKVALISFLIYIVVVCTWNVVVFLYIANDEVVLTDEEIQKAEELDSDMNLSSVVERFNTKADVYESITGETVMMDELPLVVPADEAEGTAQDAPLDQG